MVLLLCLIGYDDRCERVVAVANCCWTHCGNVVLANTTEADANRDDRRRHNVLLDVDIDDDKPRIIFQVTVISN